MYFKKLMVIALLLIALAVVACAPKPPPVTENQYEAARQETLEAEQRLAALEREKSQLEAELHSRQILHEVLQEMVSEME